MKKERELLQHLDKLHTTPLGVERIRKNTGLDLLDVVLWCKEIIEDNKSIIERKGKNWYIQNEDYQITVNRYSNTIITVHKVG